MPVLEVSASIFNMPPTSILTSSAERYTRNLADAGYDHMQYMPVRNPHLSAASKLVADGVVTGLHQSWLHPAYKQTIKDRLMGLVIPGLAESMRIIQDLQEFVPTETGSLPVVVHPNEQHLGNVPARHNVSYAQLKKSGGWHGQFIHQPTAEVMDAWGILDASGERTAERLLNEQESRGFDGIALDLHHLASKRNGINLAKKPNHWLENFVGRLAADNALTDPSEVQISFRPDFGGNPGDLPHALDGDWLQTPHGRMLEAIGESLPKDYYVLRVTTEVPPSAWEPLGIDWKQGNRTLVQAINNSPLMK